MHDSLNIGKDNMKKELRRENVKVRQVMQDLQMNFNAMKDVGHQKSSYNQGHKETTQYW